MSTHFTLFMLILALLLTFPSSVLADEFLFRDSTKDGSIFSVRPDSEKGVYRWYLGGMGEFRADFQNKKKIRLKGKRNRGSIEVNSDHEVILRLSGDKMVLQEGSLGYGCYMATLKHYGTYDENDFKQSYVFRESGANNSLWSVKETSQKGRYLWYMGSMGKVTAKVKGTRVRLNGKSIIGSLNMDELGDVTMKPKYGDAISFPAGTLGYGVYKATLQHFGTWKESKIKRETIFENMTTDGAVWKVMTGKKKGKYTWYMGGTGKAIATVKNKTIVHIKGSQVKGKIYLSKSNELVLKMGNDKIFMNSSSLGFGAFKATLKHYGSWKEDMSEVKYIFESSTHDGSLWSVKRSSKSGKYDWELGSLGRVTATVKGTTIKLRGKRIRGKIYVNSENEVIMKANGDENIFQEGSMGFGCYKATLEDAGQWKANIGVQDFLYRDATPTGGMWAVKATKKRGQYIWYMGSIGRAKARVKGDVVKLKGKRMRGTIKLGAKGDPVLYLDGNKGTVLHPGSVGESCYKVTLEHYKFK